MSSDALLHDLATWNQIVGDRPNEPNAYVRRGMAHFKLAQIAAAIADFDRAEQLEPAIKPYLWQRGLAFYYADRFAEGARQFELDLTVNARDAEETLWRYLCLARLEGPAAAQRSLLPVQPDPRRYLRRIYDFYAGQASVADVFASAAKDGDRGKFYSHLYIGLWHEAAGEAAQAKDQIQIAVERYPLDDDYMWHLAGVHQQVRGWANLT